MAGPAEADRQAVVAVLVERGGGSCLRGWRKEMDPDGSLAVSFLDFCKAASRLKLEVDALTLFGEDSPESLKLEELVPASGAMLTRFRLWIAEEFGGPSEMFMAFEPPDNSGKIPGELFKQQCVKHGFDASDAELSEIFCLFDGNCKGSVVLDDVSFLDIDEERRKRAVQKAKMNRKLAHEHLLSEVYHESRRLCVPISHRLAPRGWHAPAFDQLPEVVIEKRMNWQRTNDSRCRVVEAKFEQHLQSAYGNRVRAWRRGLDPGCTFSLSRVEVARYCRTVFLDVNMADLWKVLDRKHYGAITLEDIASQAAASLANFRLWSHQAKGSCMVVWDMVMAEARPPTSWKSTSSLPYGTFLRALKDLGWPGIATEGAGTALCNALDLYGCGIVCRTDIQWLDRWEAPDWLCQEPDPRAWAELSKIMAKVYGPPLRQWRILDIDNSNKVSWAEFERVCNLLQYTRNRGGAWRCLDKGLNGFISLEEYDTPSAEILRSFKAWVDSNFGSMEYAFKTMDADGNGMLTCAELKRVCKQRKWKGDVRTLFLCLDRGNNAASGPRSLDYSELAFLDQWIPDAQAKEDQASPSGSPKGMVAVRQPQPAASAKEVATSASEPLLPALRRPHRAQTSWKDPWWRASKAAARSGVLEALRAGNELVRSKTEQLLAEHRQLQKEAARRSRKQHPAVSPLSRTASAPLLCEGAVDLPEDCGAASPGGRAAPTLAATH